MRKNKKMLWTAACFATAVLFVVALGLLVKHEPSFYHRAASGQGLDRKNLNNDFVGNLGKLTAFWKYGKGDWNVSFSEAQINSYFEEGFLRWGDGEALRRQGISEPRLSLEQDRLRLAFRYGTGLWSTVVSYDLRVWLAPKDVNVILVEIVGHHAGALPISSQTLLNELSEIARRGNLDVSWYRHEGRPVAMIRFQGDQARIPTAQLVQLATKPGILLVAGKSNEPQVSLDAHNP